MKIAPGLGTDLIHFGVSEYETTKQLGVPDKSYLTDSNCSRLQYHDLRLELAFSSDDDNRLRWMTIHNPEAELFGRRLIGRRENEVINFISQQLDEKPEIEDHGCMLCVIYRSQWLEFQFQFGRLSCINLGVMQEATSLAYARA